VGLTSRRKEKKCNFCSETAKTQIFPSRLVIGERGLTDGGAEGQKKTGEEPEGRGKGGLGKGTQL